MSKIKNFYRKIIDRLRIKRDIILCKIFPYQITIVYKVKNSKLLIRTHHYWEDRNLKTLELFLAAFEQAKPKLDHDFTMHITCDDYDYNHTKQNIYAYSRFDGQKNINLVPDFLFTNWKECGIDDYDKCCKELMEAAKKEPEFDKLFWIGNAKMHKTRQLLCEIAETDERMDCTAMSWSIIDGKNTPTKFVSLVDHTKYKYLIDVQGNGWSARTKLLFFTGRPLFLADRRHKEYWYDDIEPFVHYIPVKEDLSDLTKMLDWAETHEEETKRIAENAMEFAKTHLTREAAIKYMEEVILNAKK